MDASEASVGNTLYLPVNVARALLFLGESHGAMVDGGVAGTAVEVSTRVGGQVDVIKGKKLGLAPIRRFRLPDGRRDLSPPG